MTIFFAITATICAVGWIKNMLSNLTLSALLVKKNIYPTDSELRECSMSVMKNIFAKRK